MDKLIHHGSGNDRRTPNPGELRTRMGNRILSTTSPACVISNAIYKPGPCIGKDSDLQAGSVEVVPSSASQSQQALIHHWHELMHRSLLLALMLMMRCVCKTSVSATFSLLAVFALPRWSWPPLAYAAYAAYAVCVFATRDASAIHPFSALCTVGHHNCPFARSPPQVLCYLLFAACCASGPDALPGHADCVLWLSS